MEKLNFWHFQPSEEHDDATPEEQHKQFLSKLVTRLVYTCNHLQSELAILRRAMQNHKDLHEDATRALHSRVQDLEQVAPRPNADETGSAPSTRQLEERVDHVVAMLGDISTFAAPATISKQLDTLKTEVQQLHQLPNSNGKTSVQHYKMPTFRIENTHIGTLFLNSKGGCQIWLSHLASIRGVQVTDLHKKISWEELTKLWKKRFIVDDAPTVAINRLFTTTQGNTSTRDKLTEWPKIVAMPDLDLPFSHLRREFYNQSCAALSLALRDREQYTTFAEIIDKAREIIKTNRAAAHEKSAWQPTYVEKGKSGPRLQHVAAVQRDNIVEDPAPPKHHFGRLSKPHYNVLMAELRDYLHTAVPTSLMDAGVEVVDLHNHIAKIDREFKTQRLAHPPRDYPRGWGRTSAWLHLLHERGRMLGAQLDHLLEKGWIRPSSSSFRAPVLFVRMKKKELRLCIDYRKLNAQTVKNANPLLRVDDLLERLGGAKSFSKLDLKSGYHQLEIRQEDRYKNAFNTRYGHFEWLVMPFGLTNAPATFQAAMTTEFRHMLDRFVLIYLDHILVYSRSLDEHVEHLRTVLERLRQAKYKANRDKCKFARQELEYLGHYVTPQGIRPLANKIEAIRVWPEPTNTTDVRSFMGLAGYYQRSITGYSRIVAPMTRLQSPKVPFVFDDDARRSFQARKTAMLMAPILSIYDPTLPTRVTADASGYGIGAVLEQHDGDDRHPVEYFSHKVPPINSLYDARKKELLAFLMALKRWQHFLLGRRRFTWVTDNNSLTYYKTQDTLSSTIGQWIYCIDQFDFTPKHLPGLSNRAADALLRRPDLCAMTHHAFAFDEELQRHFIPSYESHPDFATLYAQLSSDHSPASHYRIVEGYLLLHSRGKDFLCVPRDRRLRTRLLGEYNDSRLAGHFEVNRTNAQLRQRFRWPDLITNVTRYCDSCEDSGTKMKPSSARHPQTDGQTERAHQTAQIMLCTLIRPDQKDWVDRLPDIEFAYNTSLHPTIDVTPFELHHGGRKGRIFADLLLPRAADIDAACSPAFVRRYRELLAQARANMQKAQVCMQQQANRHRVPCPIRAGDLVWVSAEEFALEQDVRKLLRKWFGPWPTAGDEPDDPSFVINIPPHLTVHPVFHASKLATYTPAKSDNFPGRRSQDPPSMDGQQEVDHVITDHKYGSKPRQYKVTFKACDPDDTWWISGTDLTASPPLI
ncbi:hypothetical protein CBR_g12555 [Chara braunii]|uniref:Reverse transcriptase domain-containing protein n=1 Tax=Chara braunii TaxID=69332 RepID=A0A388JST4_CHABU|nr:hypothetical protein CBR_g12555 [Chara braunii]|eukprot:GBG60817.1 hypothetical protein CBR_g12555 [Chara braunii]